MRLVLRSWLLLAGVAAALACRSEPTEENEPVEADPESSHAFDPEAQALAELSEQRYISLLDPGAEPRERLRYGEQAASRKLVLTVAELDGPREDGDPKAVLLLAWTGIEAEGETRRYLYEVLEVELEGVARHDESSILEAEQLAGQATGTNAGLDQCIQTRGVPSQPDLGDLLEMFAVPLPSEAIGVGATWTRPPPRREVGHHGGPPDDVYTLVAREGDSLTIDYTKGPSAAELGGAPGMSISGRLQVSLSDPLARSGMLETVRNIGFEKEHGEAQHVARSHRKVALATHGWLAR